VIIKGAFGKTDKTKLHPLFKTGAYFLCRKYGSLERDVLVTQCSRGAYLSTEQAKMFHVLPVAGKEARSE